MKELRITAGTAKGRRLKAVAVSERSPLRPTASKVREAVFNITGPGICGANLLDLYAGTGAVGFEALSRGAGFVVFVEINPVRVELIKKTGLELGFLTCMKVYRMQAFEYLKKAPEYGDTFDFIFIDPSYQSGEVMKVLPFIAEGGILKDGGMVMVEHFSRKLLPESVGSLRQKKRYIYGDTTLTTFK
ncbi:16S rRNA (guanine(966)-N(2))-methyltransferase [hydrothermal vent metagenome]|uniref:16S rRNA (Guanine(966)-N(2))-methyltransferase n=2 Tax=hydrothermal vent metagenome TaxID=652676 RepID=A0A3B1CFH8_9ZZZZ